MHNHDHPAKSGSTTESGTASTAGQESVHTQIMQFAGLFEEERNKQQQLNNSLVQHQDTIQSQASKIQRQRERVKKLKLQLLSYQKKEQEEASVLLSATDNLQVVNPPPQHEGADTDKQKPANGVPESAITDEDREMLAQVRSFLAEVPLDAFELILLRLHSKIDVMLRRLVPQMYQIRKRFRMANVQYVFPKEDERDPHNFGLSVPDRSDVPNSIRFDVARIDPFMQLAESIFNQIQNSTSEGYPKISGKNIRLSSRIPLIANTLLGKREMTPLSLSWSGRRTPITSVGESPRHGFPDEDLSPRVVPLQTREFPTPMSVIPVETVHAALAQPTFENRDASLCNMDDPDDGVVQILSVPDQPSDPKEDQTHTPIEIVKTTPVQTPEHTPGFEFVCENETEPALLVFAQEQKPTDFQNRISPSHSVSPSQSTDKSHLDPLQQLPQTPDHELRESSPQQIVSHHRSHSLPQAPMLGLTQTQPQSLHESPPQQSLGQKSISLNTVSKQHLFQSMSDLLTARHSHSNPQHPNVVNFNPNPPQFRPFPRRTLGMCMSESPRPLRDSDSHPAWNITSNNDPPLHTNSIRPTLSTNKAPTTRSQPHVSSKSIEISDPEMELHKTNNNRSLSPQTTRELIQHDSDSSDVQQRVIHSRAGDLISSIPFSTGLDSLSRDSVHPRQPPPRRVKATHNQTHSRRAQAPTSDQSINMHVIKLSKAMTVGDVIPTAPITQRLKPSPRQFSEVVGGSRSQQRDGDSGVKSAMKPNVVNPVVEIQGFDLTAKGSHQEVHSEQQQPQSTPLPTSSIIRHVKDRIKELLTTNERDLRVIDDCINRELQRGDDISEMKHQVSRSEKGKFANNGRSLIHRHQRKPPNQMLEITEHLKELLENSGIIVGSNSATELKDDGTVLTRKHIRKMETNHQTAIFKWERIKHQLLAERDDILVNSMNL